MWQSDHARIVLEPIVALEEPGRVVAWEALSRFPGRDPRQAFAEAARAGRLVDLEILALRRSMRAARMLRPGERLSVNLTEHTLVAATPRIAALLATCGAPVVLELVEWARDPSVAGALAHLRARLGRSDLVVALDDVELDPSRDRSAALGARWMKIDAGTVEEAAGSPALRDLVAGRVRAWRAAGLGVVAEGVADERLEALARGVGATMAQGRRYAPLAERLGSLYREPAASPAPGSKRRTSMATTTCAAGTKCSALSDSR